MRNLLNHVSKFKNFYKKKISDNTIFNSLHLLLYIKSLSKTLKHVYVFPGFGDDITINVILKNKILVYQIFKNNFTIDFDNSIYLEDQTISESKEFYRGQFEKQTKR